MDSTSPIELRPMGLVLPPLSPPASVPPFPPPPPSGRGPLLILLAYASLGVAAIIGGALLLLLTCYCCGRRRAQREAVLAAANAHLAARAHVALTVFGQPAKTELTEVLLVTQPGQNTSTHVAVRVLTKEEATAVRQTHEQQQQSMGLGQGSCSHGDTHQSAAVVGGAGTSNSAPVGPNLGSVYAVDPAGPFGMYADGSNGASGTVPAGSVSISDATGLSVPNTAVRNDATMSSSLAATDGHVLP